jgi:hypothetical protein
MQVLEAAGIGIGDPDRKQGRDKFNPHGYYENYDVVDTSKLIIWASAGKRVDEPAYVPSRESIAAVCGKFDVGSMILDREPWASGEDTAVKDPRLCFTYWVWADYFADKDVRIIVATRDLEKTIRSWRKCYPGLSANQSREIIIERTNRALEWIEHYKLPYVEIRYDDWFSDPGANVAKLESLIGRKIKVDLTPLLDVKSYKASSTRVVCYSYETWETNGQWRPEAALARGVQDAYGYEIQWRDPKAYEPEPCEAAILAGDRGWSARIMRDLATRRAPFLCVTDGMVRRQNEWAQVPLRAGLQCPENRDCYWTVAKDGPAAYGQHGDYAMARPERWKTLGAMLSPWRPDGAILIACQRYPIAFDGQNRHEWLLLAVLNLAGITRRPFVVRPHPGAMMAEPDSALALYRTLHDALGDRVQRSENSLVSDLRSAWAVVTYDSNIAVEAVIAGVPAFVGGRSMAERVACQDLTRIECPPRPDRDQWARWIATCQWTTAELLAGEPWQALMGEK